MTYVLNIMSDVVTVMTGIAASSYAAYRSRDRIRLAYYAIAIWSLTAVIRYVDFVAYYLLDPLCRIWAFLAATVISFFDGG